MAGRRHAGRQHSRCAGYGRTGRRQTDRGDKYCVYYGIGKVLDAGSLFAQYTGEQKLAERAQYIMDQLRGSRDPERYLGFWNVESNNHQNVVKWTLHEQEYINLALVRNYRVTGEAHYLDFAKALQLHIVEPRGMSSAVKST